MQRSSTSANTNRDRIDQVFARLAVIYGHIWQSQFKQADFLLLAKHEWNETLSEFEETTINWAINTCKKRHEMPPTLPTLYQLCRSFEPLKKINSVAEEAYKPADPAVAHMHIRKIAEMLSHQSHD